MNQATCKAEHIAVGTEILLGQITNGHARTISDELAREGFFLYYHTAVGDNLERIKDVFRIASERSNTVIVTGGLGPTADDLTKEALAQYLERELVTSHEALSALESFFAKRNKTMPPENKKQAQCVAGGELIENPNGTAPGQYVYAGGVHYFLLPGPPLEMKPMLTNSVLPRMSEWFSQNQLQSRILHFCGIGESTVDEAVSDLLQRPNPSLAPLAGEGEMLLRITAHDTEESTAQDLIAQLEHELQRRFQDFIYGTDEDSLPSVVGRAAINGAASVSFAESCTGGLMASMVTQIPGSSAYFAGGVVAYNNDVKASVLGVDTDILDNYGAVSAQTASAMAEGVRRLTGSTYGVSITGIAGPSGGTEEKPVGLVFGAISSFDGGVRMVRMMHSGSRMQIQIRSAKRMLWELWRSLRTKSR
ncbi:competence/damage-inducible protein A [Alicyclobacillus sp. SO9]|uniref:competence/damage-inducible protein A n=1 Tax=Alicyclobacillus sp. SO9 TaxID=2665646 RepID=UPI0018E8C180|nr:competence/damage-inducible protein A [Alicyclobacillus sp. SO9]QQE80872.1 competence/damage-inducible protein A [Alicyclobacillus sp. SO9]